MIGMEITLTLKKSYSVSVNFLHSKNCDSAFQIAKIKSLVNRQIYVIYINKYHSR